MNSYHLKLVIFLAFSNVSMGFVWFLEFPDPIPGVLGHHEVMHILTLVNQVVFLFLIYSLATTSS